MDDRRRRFEAQVLPHLDAAYRFARWLARSSDSADDIVQDAMLRAFRGLDGLRGSDPKAWLLAIIRNCYLTSLEKQQRHPQVALSDELAMQSEHHSSTDSLDPESASIRRDEQRELAALLHDLPENFREVLILREIEDMGYREIASVTNLPMGTVMSRLARARSALRKQWLNRVDGESRAMS
jgi:RNA polymerase sigma-70 factor (ECF subfamily)